MLCLHIPGDVRFGIRPARKPTLRPWPPYGSPEDLAPTPVPAWSFRTCHSNPVLFQRVYWKNSSSIMGHYLLSFVHGPLPAAAVRNEQPSASPPFFKKSGPTWPTFRIRSLYVTSSQVATKLTYDCLGLPANLAGSCSESLMLVIRQKCRTSCPTFLLAAIIRAKLARIITSDQLDPKLQVRVMWTNLVHIIHFRPTWADVPYPCNL